MLPSAITPRPYQRQAVDAVGEALKSGKDHALLVMATGLGKTMTAAFIANSVLQPQFGPGKTLVLCNRNEILRQNELAFKHVLGQHIKTSRFFGDEHDLDGDYVFASLQSLAAYTGDLNNAGFEHKIFDEVHHLGAATYVDVFERIQTRTTLGLTATPIRGDGQDLAKWYGDPVFSLDLPEALGRGLLSPVNYNLKADDLVRLGSTMSDGRRVSVAEINREVFIPVRESEIARIVREHWDTMPMAPRTLVFAASIEHAEMLQKELGGAVLHSKLKTNEQRTVLDSFRKGKTATLITIDMANEGLDIPEANCLVFARTTSSQTVFYQQLGRGLRLSEGKAAVEVLDFAGNVSRIQMVDNLVKATQRAAEEIERVSLDDLDNEKGGSVVLDGVGFIANFDSTSIQILDYLDSKLVVGDREAALAQVKAYCEANGIHRAPSQREIDASSLGGETNSSSHLAKLFTDENGRAGFWNFQKAYAKYANVPFRPRFETREDALNGVAQYMEAKGIAGRVIHQREIDIASGEGELPSVPTFSKLFSKPGNPPRFANFQIAMAKHLGIAYRPQFDTPEEIIEAVVEYLEEQGIVGLPSNERLNTASKENRIPSLQMLKATFLKEDGTRGIGIEEFQKVLAKRLGIKLALTFRTQQEVLEAVALFCVEEGISGRQPTHDELLRASKERRAPYKAKISSMFTDAGENNGGKNFRRALAQHMGLPIPKFLDTQQEVLESTYEYLGEQGLPQDRVDLRTVNAGARVGAMPAPLKLGRMFPHEASARSIQGFQEAYASYAQTRGITSSRNSGTGSLVD